MDTAAEAVLGAGLLVLLVLIGLCWAAFAALVGMYVARFLNGMVWSVVFGIILLRRERIGRLDGVEVVG